MTPSLSLCLLALLSLGCGVDEGSAEEALGGKPRRVTTHPTREHDAATAHAADPNEDGGRLAPLLPATGGFDAGPQPWPQDAGATRCVAPPGVSNAPRTILQAVDLINQLPRPVTVPCFLEVLPRPLELYATSGFLSAQPAVGTRSPRLFLFLDPLILSVVPDGVGRDLVEFGELKSNTRSLKAEIAFPIEGKLRPEDAFEHLMFNERLTSCAFCHRDEVPSTEHSFTGAMESVALRPIPSERVALPYLTEEYAACDAAVEPARCAMLDAIFGQGDVVDRDFPSEMVTFF